VGGVDIRWLGKRCNPFNETTTKSRQSPPDCIKNPPAPDLTSACASTQACSRGVASQLTASLAALEAKKSVKSVGVTGSSVEKPLGGGRGVGDTGQSVLRSDQVEAGGWGRERRRAAAARDCSSSCTALKALVFGVGRQTAIIPAVCMQVVYACMRCFGGTRARAQLSSFQARTRHSPQLT